MAKPIKICLTNNGEDHETPWAHDLGPAPGPKGSRKVRLANVPFKHSKPTWGDVIVVSPAVDGFPTWDRAGVPWAKVGTRIAQDGGRWAMIVDYRPDRGTLAEKAFEELAIACAELEVVCERAWPPRGDDAGRAYLAVKTGTSDVALMKHLRHADVACTLVQVHPKPPATKKAPAKKRKKSR